MSLSKAVLLSILLLSLTVIGCGLGESPSKTPVSAPQPTPPTPLTGATDISDAVLSVVRSFLANDFAAAQKSMLLLPSEQKDPKTQRMFTDFSLHLNKRLALEAKDAGLKAPIPSLSVSNARDSQTSDSRLVDVSIRAANELEPLTLTVKATQVSGVWLVDFAPFMLALVDALEEQ